MSQVIVSCPHCSFRRDMPADKLPDQPVQATCPKCRQVFEFDRHAAPAVEPLAVSNEACPPSSLPEGTPVLPPPLPPSPAASPEEAPSGSGNNRTSEFRTLLPVGELFSQTWELYKQRWMILVALFVVTGIAAVVPPALVAVTMGSLAKNSFSGTVVMVMLLGVAVVASIVILFWGMAATVTAAVDASLGFNDAFQRAKGCWISFVWVSSLYSFIVGGASLLFIVPGILTGIWFFAGPYLVVSGDTRGMDALLKSKALVDGRFWEVLGRLVLVWLLGTVLGMIPVIGVLFSLAMAPFSMLYAVVLYRNLEDTAGVVTWSSSDGAKAGWLLLGLSGYLLVPLLLFFMLGAALLSGFQPLFKMMLEQKQRHQHTLSVTPPAAKLPFKMRMP